MKPGSLLARILVVLALFGPFAAVARAQGEAARVVFVEPMSAVAAPRAPEARDAVYRVVTDAARLNTYEGWLANEPARQALDLFARAWALTPEGRRGAAPVYYVALVPGGNHAAVGLRLADDADPTAHARTSFIQLAPEDWVFGTTFLHETGHVVLSLLHGGAEIPKRPIAAVSHTTAALTDRGTAFDEGFAIHLETLAAHFTSDASLRERYYHQRFLFGAPEMLGEYNRPAGDLLSFSQTIARYQEVREGSFAFAPAFRGPDYLRVQLEKSRDFASLRDADQLLQSEGFYASFFFSLLVRGRTPPAPEVVHERQGKVLAALAEMLAAGARSAEDPFLLLFVEAYLRKFPAEANEVVDVLLDLSRGVFVDRQAAALWRDHYLGALRVDPAEAENGKLEAARARWRTEVARDPKVLHGLLGPQLRVEVPGRSVTLVAFEESAPLSFDLNTVEEGVIRLVPGIQGAEVEAWLRHRAERPFANVQDFKRRAGLGKRTLARMKYPPAG